MIVIEPGHPYAKLGLMPACRCVFTPVELGPDEQICNRAYPPEIAFHPCRLARLRHRKAAACSGHKMGEGNICENCGASQAEVLCEDNYRQDGR